MGENLNTIYNAFNLLDPSTPNIRCTRCGDKTDELFGCLCADCYKEDIESCIRDILDELSMFQAKYRKLTGKAFIF